MILVHVAAEKNIRIAMEGMSNTGKLIKYKGQILLLKNFKKTNHKKQIISNF